MNLGHIGLWVAQVLLALFFIICGICSQAGVIISWLPSGIVPIVGLAQVGFAVALLVPSFSRVLPILTPIAVGGFLTTLTYPLTGGAVALLNVLGLLGFVVVWGRFKGGPTRRNLASMREAEPTVQMMQDIGTDEAALSAQRKLGSEEGEAAARLRAFDSAVNEIELYLYEKHHNLVPDDNQGWGPMDFDEWLGWKQRGFETTGSVWFNYPDGLPPQPTAGA